MLTMRSHFSALFPPPVFEASILRQSLEIFRDIIRPVFHSIRDTETIAACSDAFLAFNMHLGILIRGLDQAYRACVEANRMYEVVSRRANEARRWHGARVGGRGRRITTANSSDVSDLELGEAEAGPGDVSSEQRIFTEDEDRELESVVEQVVVGVVEGALAGLGIEGDEIGEEILGEGDTGKSESAIEDDVEGGGEEGKSVVTQVSHDRDVRVSSQASSRHGKHTAFDLSGLQHIRQRSLGAQATTTPFNVTASPPRRRRSWEATQRHAIYISNDEQWRNWTRFKRIRRPSYEAPKTLHGRELEGLKEEEEEYVLRHPFRSFPSLTT
jgi:hypothetical protein